MNISLSLARWSARIAVNTSSIAFALGRGAYLHAGRFSVYSAHDGNLTVRIGHRHWSLTVTTFSTDWERLAQMDAARDFVAYERDDEREDENPFLLDDSTEPESEDPFADDKAESYDFARASLDHDIAIANYELESAIDDTMEALDKCHLARDYDMSESVRDEADLAYEAARGRMLAKMRDRDELVRRRDLLDRPQEDGTVEVEPLFV